MRILITGGTGSLGQALIGRWHKTHELTILSRNPHKQQMVQAKFGLPPSAFILGDICDIDLMRRACYGQDILIHAAALKVVSQGEQFPDEYHRVNCIGSQVVAKAWADPHKSTFWHLPLPREPRRALYINSDKAIAPINHYGCTKRIGEVFFIERGFSSLRYGNVVASEGSFIHKWKDLLKKGRPIPVRYPIPTRFFLSFDSAINLIDQVLVAMGKDLNGVFIPGGLKAFDVLSVAKALTNDMNICRSEMLQPGEKQHEILLSQGEMAHDLGGDLYQVRPGWQKDNPAFSSETAPKMTGLEVLRALGVSPRQEIFC